MEKLKSTLKVYNEADLEDSGSGSNVEVKGIRSRKVLVGNDKRPSERLRVHLNIFKAGSRVPVHWHLIEALYYVISGRAVVEDIEGKKYDIGPGSTVYYPAGIAAAHGWEVKEEMQLISIRATAERTKWIQFSVDKSTMESSIKLDDLLRVMGPQFKSLY